MSDPGLDENRERDSKGFVRERIVNRQNGKRWLKKILVVGICGVIFGLTAGIALAAVFPKASGWFADEETTTQSPVVIPPDRPSASESETSTEQTTQEATESPTEETTEENEEERREEELRKFILAEIRKKKEEWLSNPEFIEELYGLMAELGRNYRKALVAVESRESVPDWFDNPVMTEGVACAGMIWNEADDGTLYILASGMETVADAHIQVVFADGSRRDAQICRRDSVTGLTMLKVEAEQVDEALREQIAVMPLGNSYGVEQGDPLLIVGNTHGYVGAVVPTVVTYADRMIYESDSVYRWIDLDAVTAEDANGFVLSLDGRIMGVITPKTAGLSTGMLAISDLKGVLELLANGQSVPYLGVIGQTVTEVIGEEHGLPTGVYVTEVQSGTPAYHAGIKAGDVIVKVGEVPVGSLVTLRGRVERLETDVPVSVVVMRAGSNGYQELTFQITPGVR